MYILSYSARSKGALALKERLNIQTLVRGHGSSGAFLPNDQGICLNWGYRGRVNYSSQPLFLNSPANIIGTRKDNTLGAACALHIRAVPSSDSSIIAREWLNEGTTIVARRNLNGHSGQGINIIKPEDPQAEADELIGRSLLFTKYIEEREEYRLHVFRGNIIDVQRKARRNGIEYTPEQMQVRSYTNGWVFVRQGVVATPAMRDIATHIIEALHLDFGAVDIIVSDDGPMLLEVNSAPGLMGTTLDKYAEVFNAVVI